MSGSSRADLPSTWRARGNGGRLPRHVRAESRASVRAVAVWRQQERDVVVTVGIGYPDADNDDVEERRIGQRMTGRAQVIAGVKRKLVHAGFDAIALEQG